MFPGRRLAPVTAVAVLLTLHALPCAAAGPPVGRPPPKAPEILERFAYYSLGISLGKFTESTLHASQLRYDWKWLAARHDADGDGRVTAAEFRGSRAWFERLDRDRDGVVTADDFDWTDASRYVRLTQLLRGWNQRLDADDDDRISRAEWDAFFTKAAGGKASLTADHLEDAILKAAGPPRRRVRVSPLVLLKDMLTGDNGSVFEGPALGGKAPGFRLELADGKGQVELAEFAKDKPVVLVFGSFT